MLRAHARVQGRRIGYPTDIVNTVVFLARDAFACVNGQDSVVGGVFLNASLANLY
ncbi:hypothetical protein [Pantoea sp. 18069]|uniref:hypothetical protein n=1 Tax=Pantoea sp. 18069 TaxID=2681415 RepID=UPI001359DEF1|nr:hypothetical protein [Pantoea sp. 18069]